MSDLSTSGPAHRVQSAQVEYGYPRGHLGHLTPDEEASFKNFKIFCEEKGSYHPGEGDKPATHDDATLLRFLRARRFIVQDAFKQFDDTEKWRQINHLDQLYETIDLKHFEETRRLYPQWTGRRDRRGMPVYVFEVTHLNSKTMAAYEKSAKETHTKVTNSTPTPPKLLRLFALYENLVRFVLPLCSAMTDRENARTPITQSNNIVDISGVGLKQFWNLRTHMQDASTLATAHYPETLDRIFIIGAPSFFPTVWGWIKKWFDPITTSKIFIIAQADVKRTLESFIDPVNIPKKYGGELDFVFGDGPILDPALEGIVKWEVEEKNFPRGPMYWVKKDGHGEKGVSTEDEEQMSAIAVGSIGGVERRETVCTVTTILPKDPLEQKPTLENGHAKEPVLETAKLDSDPNVAPVLSSQPKTEVEPESQPSKDVDPTTKPEVEAGVLVPPSRPEPTTFHSAQENLATLSLNEKSPLPNGITGPHSTNTANLLDPNVN